MRELAAVIVLCAAGCGGSSGQVGGNDGGGGGVECMQLAACCFGDTTCSGFVDTKDQASCKLAKTIYCDRDMSIAGGDLAGSSTDLSGSSLDGNIWLDGSITLDGGPRDFSISGDLAGRDLTPSLIGCLDLITCTNACTTQACLTNCHRMATAQANALNQALDDCLVAVCEQAADGATGPCAVSPTPVQCDDCVVETQTGTSPTGMPNGACQNGAGANVSDPVCGLCVDPLIACANDLTM